MSDEVIIKVGLDASAAVAAAKELPDSIERNARKEGEWTKLPGRVVRIPGTTQYQYLNEQQYAERQQQERKKKVEEQAARERAAMDKQAADSNKGTLSGWVREFKDNIDGKLVSSFSAASLALKGFGFMVDLAKGAIGWIYDSYRMSASYGISAKDRIGSTALAISSAIAPEEVEAAAKAVQRSMINAVRLQDPAATRSMRELGINEEDFRAGRVSANDALIKLAGKYKSMQGGMQFDLLAKNLGLSNWEDLIPLLEKDEKTLSSIVAMTKGGYAGGFAYAKTGIAPPVAPEVPNKMPLMGPGPSLPQILQNVSSLQAMGGGDVLSAVARGATVETNIQRIADNTGTMAQGAAKPTTQPAIIGR